MLSFQHDWFRGWKGVPPKPLENYQQTHYYILYHQRHAIEDTPWYIWWKELIDKYKILKKRDFEFLALVIVRNHEATELDCIHTLNSLIPDLLNHLTIKLSYNNGNVQYDYTPFNPKTQTISKLMDTNPYSPLQ